jgi:hypothetical protein
VLPPRMATVGPLAAAARRARPVAVDSHGRGHHHEGAMMSSHGVFCGVWSRCVAARLSSCRRGRYVRCAARRAGWRSCRRGRCGPFPVRRPIGWPSSSSSYLMSERNARREALRWAGLILLAAAVAEVVSSSGCSRRLASLRRMSLGTPSASRRPNPRQPPREYLTGSPAGGAARLRLTRRGRASSVPCQSPRPSCSPRLAGTTAWAARRRRRCSRNSRPGGSAPRHRARGTRTCRAVRGAPPRARRR